MPEWKETQEGDQPPTKSSEGLSQTGIAAMQGNADTRDAPKESIPDQAYQDTGDHDLTMRTHKAGDHYYVRAYDNERTPDLPDTARYGDAGRANLTLERDMNGDVTRARLNDIETLRGYEKMGTGSRMLDQCESIAKSNGAQEIYGDAPDKDYERHWYSRRDYQYRAGGREVYKEF